MRSMELPSRLPPDLLEFSPTTRIDWKKVDTAVVFAFAGSASGGLFSDALAQARRPASTWDPECFVADLFVERFARDSLQGKNLSPLVSLRHLIGILCSPPSDFRSVEMRRGILAELDSSPALRASLDSLYGALCRFQGNLEGTSGDLSRRQIDILLVFRSLMERLAEFESASSGLRRLAEFGREVSSSEAFTSLVALLDYDEKMASVDFRVRMGADGRVRHLQLLSVTESEHNPFQTTPLRRWLGKLELFARGFQFGSGEVLARLLDAVFEGIRPVVPALVQVLGDLEFYLGALRFADRSRSIGLDVCLPVFGQPAAARRLEGLFNPLLLGQGIKPVPCNVSTDRQDTTLLITGPNSGGKTRLLQALGLTQLMAQSGMFVPARSAQMALSQGLVVSLIQETQADQTEGRLGVEMMRIRTLFERLPVGAIVILDELCSGTNPSEGEEIFELVVRMLARLQPQAFITTHFLEFASRLEREGKIEPLRFLQVQLGTDHEPTYQFTEGVATTSLAARAASRLGVTGDQLLALIDQKLAQTTPSKS